jgi:hypothetical protein
MLEFWKAPRVAEVYNLGGGKGSACSIMEAFDPAWTITKPLAAIFEAIVRNWIDRLSAKIA